MKIGSLSEIEEIFPPLRDPIKHTPSDDAPSKSSGPIVNGAGFFTPELGNAGFLFRGLKPDINQLQPFRMAPPPGPRDSLYNLSFVFLDIRLMCGLVPAMIRLFALQTPLFSKRIEPIFRKRLYTTLPDPSLQQRKLAQCQRNYALLHLNTPSSPPNR